MFKLAVIREAECIGCTQCLNVCPVDAIVGSIKQMHTVIKAECIGCEKCLPACPVDCIDLIEVTEKPYQPLIAKQRAQHRLNRLAQENTKPQFSLTEKQAIIAAAVAKLSADKKN